jgi:hypothetical protein
MFFIKGNQRENVLIFFSLEIIFCRNPVLNKSFDILPQIKDDDPTSSDNSVSEIISKTKSREFRLSFSSFR